MKMHHLDKEQVEAVMQKVKEVVDSGQYPADTIEAIFELSKVDGKNFLEYFDLAHALHQSEHMLHEAGRHAPSWAHLLTPKEHNIWIEVLLMIFSLGVAII